MQQSRLTSLLETCVNVAIGFIVSMFLTATVLPAMGHTISLHDNVIITSVFTVASIARGYVIRRWFNARIKLFIKGALNE